jgi:alkaline phosphatase D
MHPEPGTSSAPPTVDRRTLIATAGAAGAALGVVGVASGPASAANRYFRHGVASGDPRPRSVVLWTRVTPTDAAQPGSGRGPTVTVRWEVAQDRRFRRVVSQGKVRTGPARDHTVKLDARGLAPDTTYFFRFLYRGSTSRVGTTRTAPRENADNAHLRFGLVSCANLQAGWFSPYRHLAMRDDLDAVLHMGDYLYEYAPGEYGYGQGNEDIRRHDPPREMVSLEDYRRRHAQYKLDPDLQKLHAKAAFIITWDDHEVTNDQWRRGAENHNEGEGDYLERRARAHRAFDEWMPTRMGSAAEVGDGTRLFRRLRFGRLVELSMLDLRTYRSKQAEYAVTPVPSPDPAVDDPDRTITGDAQMAWLRRSLTGNRTLWKLVGNPVMIAPVQFPPLPDEVLSGVQDVTKLYPPDGAPYNVDQWDGYTADRRELFAHLQDQAVQNAVFLTGDIHSGWACDLPVDAGSYPANPATVGTEFVCTSVTSNNLKDITGDPSGATSTGVEEGIKTVNRHVKYLNFDDHGYSVVDINRRRLQVDYFIISDRRDRRATVQRTASWATRVNSQRVHAVDKGIDD